MQNDLRHWIALVEAAHGYGGTFWFNPLTRQTIACGDHGDRVAQNPDEFDIDDQAQQDMAEASRPEPDEDDNDYLHGPVVGLWGQNWGVNDAWEQLAMNQGWVRVGIGRNGKYATYVSASTAKAVWITVTYLTKDELMTDRLDIEISRQQGSVFVMLAADDIERFVRGGGRNAEAFLAKAQT